MHTLEKLRDMLMEELDKCAEKDNITTNGLYTIDKLSHAIKCIDTIIAMEESGYSNESSYARGRRGNVRRDSMGRYSRNSYENAYDGGSYRNAYRGGGSNRGYSRERGYSRDEAKEELVEQLREISMGAEGEHKQMVEEWIRQVESR